MPIAPPLEDTTLPIALRRIPNASMLPASAPASVRVRRAEMSDLDDLVMLEDQTFDSDSALVLVASANHRNFLGTAVVFFRKGSHVARLYSIASKPEARGKGVGAALLDAVETAARQRRCRVVRLEVREDNAGAVRLYERLGYRLIGHYPHYYQDGTHAWRYEKSLD